MAKVTYKLRFEGNSEGYLECEYNILLRVYYLLNLSPTLCKSHDTTHLEEKQLGSFGSLLYLKHHHAGRD